MKEENKSIKIISSILVIILLVISFGFFLNLFSSSKNEDIVKAEDPPPGVEEEEIILPPDTPVTYSMQECYTYLESLDIFQALFDLEYIEEAGPDSYETPEADSMYTELIQDNQFSYTYWSYFLKYNNLEVQVDAFEQEVIYIHNSIISNGEITIEDAIDIGQDIIDELAPNIGEIQPTTAEATVLHKATDENSNTEVINGYSLIYVRMEGSIETSDRILIDIDSSGNLLFFSIKWNIIIPIDTSPELTEQDAFDIAQPYFDDPTNDRASMELMIVRPNYLYTYGMRYGFLEGELIWMVIEYEDIDYQYPISWVFVEANEGEVIGGF